MNVQEAIDYIHNTYQFGSKLGLHNITKLLGYLGDPQDTLRYVHVAGTNGKGSTSSMIYSILKAEGYRVGLYTSPYLEVFNERIRIDGQNISDESLAEVATLVKTQVDRMLAEGDAHPTEFEIVTAVAFEYFRQEQVEFVVLEVGLGGRLDSTNVIKKPLVSVITPIDLDHVEYLGDTIGKVAFEKAGIIKANSVCVIHPQVEEAETVIATRCGALGTRLVKAPCHEAKILDSTLEGTRFQLFDQTYSLKLIGDYQVRNAVVALTAVRTLREVYGVPLSDESIQIGLAEAQWPGRLEVMAKEPVLVMIDGAHNLHGASGLSGALRRLLGGRRIVAVVGILGDKDISGMLAEMMPLVHVVIATEPDNPRKMSAEGLADHMSGYDAEIHIRPVIKDALDLAFQLAAPGDAIVCFGSLYMIGQARTLLRQRL
ncbi:MAG: folylpolyglutamate synthase/dihydrofolate synthase family protein [Erysipelotrichaceae bacterium]|nr:folylpolyglutamate synthase/dihydrofolate synthase family protein [Erysipelotrichaceae bacterium]